MTSKERDFTAARHKVDAIRGKALHLGWPEDRLEALVRVLDDDSEIGEVLATRIEISSKTKGISQFFVDRETSLRMAGERARKAPEP